MKLPPNPIIEDIQEDPDFILVTDSQEVEGLKGALYMDNADNYGAFFVKIKDGTYTHVYGFNGNVPDLHKRIYPLLEVEAQA